MRNPNVTLQVIADKAHVSRALVSRVLNNRPVRVSEQKRAQIIKIANELDYVPSGQILANTPSPKLNKTIALIQPNLNFQFLSLITEGIIKHAYDNGYSVIVFDSKEDSALELKYLELCHTLGVTGIILNSFANSNNKNYIEKLYERRTPVVFIDCYPNDSRFSIVSSRNNDYMYQLTESLIARGHQNILSIIQDKSTLTNVSLERLNGYYKAMNKYGLPGYNEIIYPDRDYRQQPIFSLLNSSQKFTAFIINTAWDVPNFCNLIRETHYLDGGDFEIGVFDDFLIPFTDYASGANRDIYSRIVSTVIQRPKEIAVQAVDILIESIKKGEAFSPIQQFIDCDLILMKREQPSAPDKDSIT